MDKKNIVLVVPYRGIGDIIFHIPLIRGLYLYYQKKIILVTNSTNKSKFLLKNEKSIKKIKYVDFTREKLLQNSLNLYRTLNSYKSSLSVLTAPSKRLILPLILSNGDKKILFKKTNNKDLSSYIFSQSKEIFKNINFIENYKLTNLKKNYNIKNIFVNLDSHHDQNNWKEVYFIDLIKKLLLKKKVNKLFINFSPNKKKKFFKTINYFKNEKKIFFLYKSNFEIILDSIKSCKYIISNESGPVCLGASFNKVVFSIYNPKYTPNLSSKSINKNICYFDTSKLKYNQIISSILRRIF